MSSKDKTRDKLMSSMRKTKAAAESSKSKNDKEQAPSENKAVPVKNKLSVASKPAKSTVANESGQAVNSYWAAKRVWPD